MDTNLKFNSAICTSREQSERLLDLGLKKDTADCHWAYHSVTATRYVVAHPYDGVGECIPAWSLHRLIEIAELPYSWECISGDWYNEVIADIQSKIYIGELNKEYLED